MQDYINEIINVPSIQKQVEDTNKALESLSVHVDTMVNKFKQLRDEVGKSKNIDDLTKSTKEYNTEADKANKVINEKNKLTSQLTSLQERLKVAQTEEYENVVRAREALRLKNAEVTNAVRATENEVSSLAGMRAALSLATAEYDKLSMELL